MNPQQRARKNRTLRWRVCPSCKGRLRVELVQDWKDQSRSRTYLCNDCAAKFVSHETTVAPAVTVAKKNGTVELFRPEKLARSIQAIAHTHKMPKDWPMTIALEVGRIPGPEPTDSTTGIIMRTAKLMAIRDPGLACRYLIATGDATYADIVTYLGWVREWMSEGSR